MKKEAIVFILTFIFILPVASASLSSGMNEIQNYVDQYKAGTLSAPQLVVYIEYAKNKIYEELDKQGIKAFTETEIQTVFSKSNDNPEETQRVSFKSMDNDDWRFSQYEKRFLTDDFHVVFRADSFYRHDREYYEQREEDFTNYYTISYELVAINTGSFSDLGSEIKSFISDVKELIETNGDADDEEELRKSFSNIRQKMNDLDRDNCIELMQDIGMTEEEESFGKDKNFHYLIKEQIDRKCRNEQKCEPGCEPMEICKDCTPKCQDEEVCKELPENQICCKIQQLVQCISCPSPEPTYETRLQEECVSVPEAEVSYEIVADENCEVCEMQEVCTGCEDACIIKQNCDLKCEDVEKCDEFSSEEISLQGHCGKGSNIHISARGDELGRYQGLNQGGGWGKSCDFDIQNHVKLRQVLQKDVNSEFAKWYFEEFLIQDYDKMINGDGGFKYVLELLTRNEEKISESFHCSETQEWPAGFEKIDITYINNNTHVEVWEKHIPVEHNNAKYYTTLYKYSWVPSRELLKGLIDYKISETDTIGPSAKDVAKIKADRGQMEVVNSLSERYGGSFDVKLELKEEGENVVLKYLQINPDVAVKIVDSIDGKPDISIEVDYNVLYDFISYISYEKEADRIYGPHWVHVEGRGGPGNFFGVLGAVSKMWREGITIKPRYALLKLLFNSKNVIGLMQGRVEPSAYPSRIETVEVNAEVIKQW